MPYPYSDHVLMGSLILAHHDLSLYLSAAGMKSISFCHESFRGLPGPPSLSVVLSPG